MYTRKLLHNWLKDAREWCHLARFRSLVFAINALQFGGKLSLTGLGRTPVKGGTAAKHQIKKMDRLLGNSRLLLEVDRFSGLLAKKIIGTTAHPVLLVDWTPLWGPFSALTAAVPCSGRALLVFWKIHRLRFVGNEKTQTKFLEDLSKVLPHGARPIIVTDAGFHAPWFHAIKKLNWDYVGRVRAHVKCRRKNERWFFATDLFEKAKLIPQNFGLFEVSKSNTIEHRLVLIRQRRKPGPKKKRIFQKQKPGPPQKGEHKSGITLTEQQNKHRKSANEPWLLATSLNWDEHRVVAIYKSRMQTEESYRLLKSHRFGWSMDQSKNKCASRIRILLLIAAIAIAFLSAVGVIAESRKLQRRYQANTIRNRRVISLILLAQFSLRDRLLHPSLKEIETIFPRFVQQFEIT